MCDAMRLKETVASFFFPSTANQAKPYGPIKELLSGKDPPIHRVTSVEEYVAYHRSKGPTESASLPHFKLSP